MVTPIIVRHSQTKPAPKTSLVARAVLQDDTLEDAMEDDESSESSDMETQDQDVVVTRMVARSPKLLGSETLFTTSRPEGKMRDVITIDCYKINESDFKGTISYEEANEKIFTGALGLPVQLLHSLKMSYTDQRTVSFK